MKIVGDHWPVATQRLAHVLDTALSESAPTEHAVALATVCGAAAHALLPGGSADCWDTLTEVRAIGPIWQAFVRGWHDAAREAKS